MPRLRYYNANSTGGLYDRGSWVVRLTTEEDKQAVLELRFGEHVGVNITDHETARRICDRLNDLANRIRNPPTP